MEEQTSKADTKHGLKRQLSRQVFTIKPARHTPEPVSEKDEDEADDDDDDDGGKDDDDDDGDGDDDENEEEENEEGNVIYDKSREKGHSSR